MCHVWKSPGEAPLCWKITDYVSKVWIPYVKVKKYNLIKFPL